MHQEMHQKAIETLADSCKNLLDNNHLVTQEAAIDLSGRIEALKFQILQQHKASPVFLRPFNALKMWVLLFKIKKLESLLKNIKKEARKNGQAVAIDKCIRGLQRKGLLLAMSKESCLEGFKHTCPELQTLGYTSAFCFRIIDRDEGTLELLVSSDSGHVSSYSFSVKEPIDIEALLQQKAPLAIPLSQLQDIAGWLHNHGAIHAPILSREAIEQKLEGLMKSCPHGAYVMHAQNKALTLSRLSPRGQIEHLIINLQKELGCYAIEGSSVAATRTQFKRRLEQMGTPVRLVINNKN